MNLFEGMLVGHLAGDYILQTRWMAANKDKKLGPLIVHSAIYTGCILIFAWPVQMLPVAALLAIFFSHMILDRRSLVHWWMKSVNGIQEDNPNHSTLKMIVDQSFHVLILALVAYACIFNLVE